jgi:signal transduction histidine kinase
MMSSTHEMSIGQRLKAWLPDAGGPNAPGKAVRILRRCAVAAVCVLVALAIRALLTPLLGDELPFMSFVAAALVAASYGGAMAGTIALVLGLLLADFFFIPPKGSIGVDSWSLARLEFIRYLSTVALGIMLIEILRRARIRAEHAAEELRQEVARRQQSEAALLEAKAQIRSYADQLETRVAERTAKLEATLDSLQNVLYHIAHDLRAPLRAMHGFTTALISEYAPNLDAVGKDYAWRVGAAAERMDRLIQDLLAYGRLGHADLPVTPLDLGQAVEHAVSRLQHVVETKGAQIEVSGPLPKVLANEGLLDRILVNLLDNALKFVAPGVTPSIRIRAESIQASTTMEDNLEPAAVNGPGRFVRLWVEDNGIGVASEHHERIFRVFERLDDRYAYEGTGIGLAIVSQGMQHMRGRVGIESRLGAGSRFWLELPVPRDGDP